MNLVELSRTKGFMSHDKLHTVYDWYYPMWMCELQRWLRENYRIESNIIFVKKHSVYIPFVWDIINDDEPKRLNGTNGVALKYGTYEEALEKCLIESLKLMP